MSPARTLAAAAAGAALLLAPARAAPQQADEGARGSAPAEIAEAPRQFHLGLSVSAMSWEEADDRSPTSSSLWGASVERILFRYLAVRLDAAYGTNRVQGAADSVDVATYLAEVAAVVRIAPPSLERTGVVPFVTAGVGSLVHDPDREGLTTASQNALSWGLGVEVIPLDRFGFRAEWRRYDVDLENLFDAVDRTGVSRNADRFEATAFWTF